MRDRLVRIAALAPDRLTAVSRSAALLHGVETLPPGIETTAWPVEFAVTDHAVARALPASVRAHRWRLPDGQCARIDGIRVTDLDRTLVDCARMLPRLEAQAAVDQLIRRGARLEAARSVAGGLRWHTSQLQSLRSILDDADGRAESPMESWCRRLVLDAGLPAPRPQAPVRLGDGRVVRLDLGFEEFSVGAEYDGMRHHSAPADLVHDRRRRARIAHAGWRLVVFRSESVIADPEQMLRTLVHELRSSGWRPSAAKLERVSKRINFIAMRRRLEREAKLGVKRSCAPWRA